jgi:hypothetical protein
VSCAWAPSASARACVSTIWRCVSVRLSAMNRWVSGSRPVMTGVVSIASAAIALAVSAASPGEAAATTIVTRLLSAAAWATTRRCSCSGSVSSPRRSMTRCRVARWVATEA